MNRYLPTTLLYSHVRLFDIPALTTHEDVVAISLQDQTIYRFQDNPKYRSEKRVTFGLIPFRIISTLLVAAVANTAPTVHDLVDAVWRDDPDGGPVSAYSGVYSRISQAREKLRYLGISIRPLRNGIQEAVFTPPIYRSAAA